MISSLNPVPIDLFRFSACIFRPLDVLLGICLLSFHFKSTHTCVRGCTCIRDTRSSLMSFIRSQYFFSLRAGVQSYVCLSSIRNAILIYLSKQRKFATNLPVFPFIFMFFGNADMAVASPRRGPDLERSIAKSRQKSATPGGLRI